MRIIKAGDPKKNCNRRVWGTCKECGCEVECSRHECEYIQDVVCQPGYIAIACPNCGRWIEVF